MAKVQNISWTFIYSRSFPGLLIGGCLMVYSWFYCKKNGEDKEKLREYVKVRQHGFLDYF